MTPIDLASYPPAYVSGRHAGWLFVVSTCLGIPGIASLAIHFRFLFAGNYMSHQHTELNQMSTHILTQDRY
ncbi:hypothetical protein CBS63078_3635 [Aspergillus niger]|nr:hypothetical protein CBS11350_4380 [Aspergillus niger]KAI2846744.1 hypothetical protein CBS12448_9457 [Aspergillus niger]KAI2897101.1 hypothetical protein CBS11852_4135 [Aspergillus niger]KAI2900460.1 hypothetical protein CBS13152_2051 [Aspergillus niger]KAI2913894.1 hypothetical protein CBS63078_3635 [Aspergillus niger]